MPPNAAYNSYDLPKVKQPHVCWKKNLKTCTNTQLPLKKKKKEILKDIGIDKWNGTDRQWHVWWVNKETYWLKRIAVTNYTLI